MAQLEEHPTATLGLLVWAAELSLRARSVRGPIWIVTRLRWTHGGPSVNTAGPHTAFTFVEK